MKWRELWNGIKKGQREFGENISAIINSVLLSFVYIIGVGLTSLIAKIFKKHFLDMKKEPGSYWEDLQLTTKKREEYFRQF